MKTARPDNECPICGELTGNPHSPDCDYLKPPYIPPAELPDFSRLPEMAPTRMNLLDWRQNGFDARLGELESHSLPYRLETLEAFLDFDPKAPASDALPDDIHGLIAEGMTGVTTDMHEHVAKKVTELSSRLVEKIESVSETFMSMGANVHCAEYNADLALDRIEALTVRIDAWEQRTELLEQRLEALETKTGGKFDSDYWDVDCCRVCGADKQATHAPWCEYRDGSPVAEIDRFRIFAESVLTRLEALETKAPR